jgi:Flp pilus assembly protein protease CpaA
MFLTFGIQMDAFFIGLFVWCAYTDLKRREVTNTTIVAMLVLGIAKMIVFIVLGIAWWQYPAGLLLAIPFFIAWLKNGIGAGDVKLILAIALYLGLLNTLVAFALMIPVLIVLMAYSWCKHRTLKYRIPLAPLIGIGAAGSLVLGYLY